MRLFRLSNRRLWYDLSKNKRCNTPHSNRYEVLQGTRHPYPHSLNKNECCSFCPLALEITTFPVKDSAKTLSSVCISSRLLRKTAQRYENFLQTALKLRGIASKYQSVWTDTHSLPLYTATSKQIPDITAYEKSPQLHRLQGFVRVCKLVLLVESLLNGNGYCDGGAYHRVVAHSEEAHHLHVRGN